MAVALNKNTTTITTTFTTRNSTSEAVKDTDTDIMGQTVPHESSTLLFHYLQYRCHCVYEKTCIFLDHMLQLRSHHNGTLFSFPRGVEEPYSQYVKSESRGILVLVGRNKQAN